MCPSLCIRKKNTAVNAHINIHTSFPSNGLLLCDKRSRASSGPPTQQENQVMHLEMVRATNTNKRFVIKVGYYSGPQPTPDPDGGGDREHCELGEEGWTTYIIRAEELLI